MSFGVFVALVGLGSAGSAVLLRDMAKRHLGPTFEAVARSSASHGLALDMLEVRRLEKDLLLTIPTPEAHAKLRPMWEGAVHSLERSVSRFALAHPESAADGSTGGDMAMLAAGAIERYAALVRAVLDGVDEKYVVHPTAAMQHVESGAGEMEEAAWRAVDLAAVDEARSSVLSQRLTSVIWRQVNTAVLLSVVGTACGLVLTFWLPRLLALRSARLAEALRTAAEAGGRVRVPVTGNDELAAIARSINELGDRIAQNHAELALAARKMELTNADLRASEQRLELAISCASVGMGEWNGTSGVARANDRLSTMLGYRPGEVPLKAHAWLGLVHVEDRPAVQALAARAMFGGVDEIESEHRMRHNNGEDRWVQVRGRVLQRDAEGRALRVVLAQIDVTERVRAMERLEAQLAEASSSAADGTERIEQLRSSLRAPILALISLALLTQDESVDERARAQRAHRIAQRARAVLGVLDRPQLRGAEFENQMLLDAIESLGRAA